LPCTYIYIYIYIYILIYLLMPVLQVVSSFLCTLAIASCVPVLPSYNTASSLAEKARSANYYNQDSYAKDASRIRHVSTTLLGKTDSANDLAVALSQPVPVQNVVEPLIPVVDPAAIAGPIVPIVEPSVPLVEPTVPYIGARMVGPLIPYDPRAIRPLVPYTERTSPLNVPLIGNVVPNYGTPLGPVVEPVLPYFGSPYAPILEPFTAFNFPGYYGIGTGF
jgi:hypothetical protein